MQRVAPPGYDIDDDVRRRCHELERAKSSSGCGPFLDQGAVEPGNARVARGDERWLEPRRDAVEAGDGVDRLDPRGEALRFEGLELDVERRPHAARALGPGAGHLVPSVARGNEWRRVGEAQAAIGVGSARQGLRRT